MLATPQILPISDMRNRHPEVMKNLANGPVFLTLRGEGTAVLLSMEQWEQIVGHLEEQADIIDVLEAQLAEAQGEEAEPFGPDELSEMAAPTHVPA
jgi:prevent-host-death family protein